MEACLVKTTGLSRDECKTRQVQRMFAAVGQVLRSKGLNFSSDEGEKRFHFNMVSAEHDTDHSTTIRIKPDFVMITASWTKRVPEPRRRAVAMFAMAFNYKLNHNTTNLDIDQDDGEVVLSTTMPVGVMAKSPTGMLKYYVDQSGMAAEIALTGAKGIASGENNDPLEHGEATATLLNMLTEMKHENH